MIQHPIPQNISAYQFHLVGDMTLKQFLEIVAGVLLALLINATNLFGPLKLALIVFSVLTGLALAFLPIEERPLDQWLLAFIKSIYTPTLFIWRKSTLLPPYFSYIQKNTPLSTKTQELMAAQAARKKAGLTSFLLTLPQHQAANQLEVQETQSLNHITSLFSSPPPIQKSITPPSPTPKPQPPNLPHISIPVAAPIKIDVTPKLAPRSPAKPKAEWDEVGTAPSTPGPQPTHTLTALARHSLGEGGTAISDQTLPFPSPPITPNTLVGMVLDSSGKIIDNAIIEVRDQQGLPVRATKTNRLGQFFSTTPLKNGPYELEVEAPHHTFAPIKLQLTGKIIAPLKIQANN